MQPEVFLLWHAVLWLWREPEILKSSNKLVVKTWLMAYRCKLGVHKKNEMGIMVCLFSSLCHVAFHRGGTVDDLDQRLLVLWVWPERWGKCRHVLSLPKLCLRRLWICDRHCSLILTRLKKLFLIGHFLSSFFCWPRPVAGLLIIQLWNSDPSCQPQFSWSLNFSGFHKKSTPFTDKEVGGTRQERPKCCLKKTQNCKNTEKMKKQLLVVNNGCCW